MKEDPRIETINHLGDCLSKWSQVSIDPALKACNRLHDFKIDGDQLEHIETLATALIAVPRDFDAFRIRNSEYWIGIWSAFDALRDQYIDESGSLRRDCTKNPEPLLPPEMRKRPYYKRPI